MILLQSQIVSVQFKPQTGAGPGIFPTHQGHFAWTPIYCLSPFQESSQLVQ